MVRNRGQAVVSVVEIDLDALGVRFPRSGVGMVLSQPHIKFTQDEPIVLRPERKQKCLQDLQSALNVSLGRHHRADRTHFTVLPEDAVPGLDGVTVIDQALAGNEWPSATVVIGGVDGLTNTSYAQLLQLANTTASAGNSPAAVTAQQWVNCVVTWVKDAQGQVHRWVQPKLSPAWVELNRSHQTMFQGETIYVFKASCADTGVPLRFASLLCYDWVGERDGRRVWELLLDGINTAAQDAYLTLDWMFVPQCNPVPSHASFMSQVTNFFQQGQFAKVLRDDTCLVMANVAGRDEPGKCDSFGQSAVIFASQKFVKPSCMPTYCNGGSPFRAGNPLESCRDALFRESGACVHSLLVKNPKALPLGAAGRRVAVEHATVHSLSDKVDHRTPGAGVAAEVKWVNDELDERAWALSRKYPEAPLAAEAKTAHEGIDLGIRQLQPHAVRHAVLMASVNTKREESVDKWADAECKAVDHVLNSLSILGAAGMAISVHAASAHATVSREQAEMEMVAVLANGHEDADKHVRDMAPRHRGRLLVVSRDAENTLWGKEFGSIFDKFSGATEEVNITDPESAIVRIGYQNLLQAYRTAQAPADVLGVIDAALN